MSEEQKTENITPVPPVETVAQAAASAVPAVMKMEFTKKGKAIIIGSITSVVAIAAVVIFLLWPKTEELPEEPTPAGVLVINEANYTEIMADIREKVARGMFETHMNTTWIFPDSKSPSSNAVMGNSPNNNFPFWFTVTVRETGDIVYTSGLLPVGTQIAEIILDEELPAGEYPAVVNINMIDDEGEPVESNMGFNITLRIRA